MSYDMDHLRTPPHSVPAEQAVLGGLMIDPGAFGDVAEILTAEDFYRPEHRIMWSHMVELNESGSGMDVVELAQALGRSGEIANIGGVAYIAEVAGNTPSAANILNYARAVRDRSLLRGMIVAGNDIASAAYDPGQTPTSDLIDQAQAKVMALGEQVAVSTETTNQILKRVIETIDRRFNSGGEITGLATGFADIDKRLRGLQPSDLIIIAARPSMGKTTFAMNIAEHCATALKKRVLVFSMEMPAEQLIERMTSSISKINLDRVLDGKLEEDDWPRLSAAVNRMNNMPLVIDDRAALSIQQIRNAARKHHQREPLSLIIVDYLQLARGASDNRNEEVSQISRGLKAIAKELKVPVVALSQLSRKVEDRPDKRPRNSDLRDSGSIEQDADIVMMLYRDEIYYKEDTDRKGILDVETTKFRNGEIGTDSLACNLHRARFDNLSHEARPPPISRGGRSKKSKGLNY